MDARSREILTLTLDAVRQLVTTSDACRNWSSEQREVFLTRVEEQVARRQEEPPRLTLKSIWELIGGPPFLVEKYQRGYKWTAIQVKDLLDDIDAFDPERDGRFYCLQPLVVRCPSNCPDGPVWELIDGQQRLTTIYLVLTYLKNPTFELRYQTRPGCTTFLAPLPQRCIAPDCTWKDFVQAPGNGVDNVDNFHFFQAWQTIADWFSKSPDKRQPWLAKLLHQTNVIWYDVTAQGHDASTEIFMRINSGKIALTNAELVKALFLKEAGAEDTSIARQEIAQEWDRFEQALQRDAFWYFLTGNRGEPKPNRIELVFDILSRRPASQHDDPFHTFNYFAGKPKITEEWRPIKELFLRLQDWFEDDETYHLIGFLVAAKVKRVDALARERADDSKRDFAKHLNEYIRVALKGVDLDGLRYGVDNEKIQRVLLLFNVRKHMGDQASTDGARWTSGNRFPFDRFVKEKWSLEHIHAQHSQQLDDESAAEAFYDTLAPLLTSAAQEVAADEAAKGRLAELQDSLEAWKALPNKRSDAAKKLVDVLRERSFAYFGDDIDKAEMDGIDNLALLDRNANSGLNNAIFPAKRNMIRCYDRRGRFIPMGTKDVFMKYYSDKVMQMSVWGRVDRAAYLDELKRTLEAYLPEPGRDGV